MLAQRPELAPLVRNVPGIRLPGAVDPHEILMRAMIGQQITVKAATSALTVLAAAGSEPRLAVDGFTRLFPSASDIAASAPDLLRGPARRGECLALLRNDAPVAPCVHPNPSDSPNAPTQGSDPVTSMPLSPAAAATIATPDGPFTIIEADGAVLSSGWTASVDELTGQIHSSLRHSINGQESPGLTVMADAVRAYYDGDLAAIDGIPVRQVSGPFRSHAWEVLRGVRPGAPVTYTQYAELAGSAGAVRAAAGACARNAAALFVPCHRVVRTDGSLGGFRWGLDIKQRLLDRELGAATVLF